MDKLKLPIAPALGEPLTREEMKSILGGEDRNPVCKCFLVHTASGMKRASCGSECACGCTPGTPNTTVISCGQVASDKCEEYCERIANNDHCVSAWGWGFY